MLQIGASPTYLTFLKIHQRSGIYNFSRKVFWRGPSLCLCQLKPHNLPFVLSCRPISALNFAKEEELHVHRLLCVWTKPIQPVFLNRPMVNNWKRALVKVWKQLVTYICSKHWIKYIKVYIRVTFFSLVNSGQNLNLHTHTWLLAYCS